VLGVGLELKLPQARVFCPGRNHNRLGINVNYWRPRGASGEILGASSATSGASSATSRASCPGFRGTLDTGGVLLARQEKVPVSHSFNADCLLPVCSLHPQPFGTGASKQPSQDACSVLSRGLQHMAHTLHPVIA
jgi:hypothetical protein